ncbi:MAG: hypothetical protein ACI8P9_002467 [Parasphingorhabdus sp.]|jgi:hypothetical protein
MSSVVLVSHWRPINSTAQSGTPTEWLNQQFEQIIELNCNCLVSEAAHRFANRQRHPGHLDNMKSTDDLHQWLSDCYNKLPLGIGSLIDVDTHHDVGAKVISNIADKILVLS